MRLSRWVLRTVLVSTLALGLVGCGSEQQPTSSTSDQPSTSVTTDAPSPSETSEPPADQVNGAVSPASFMSRLKDGYGDSGSARMSMRMTGGPAAVKVDGEMSYGKGDPEMRVRTSGAGMPAAATVLVTGGKAYTSLPGLTPPGKFFEVPKDSPLLQGITEGPGSLSLDQAFAAFDTALTKVEEVGPDTIGGTETTRYKLTVDAQKAMRAGGMADTPQGKAALGSLPDTIVYDVWLDQQDRMRRMTFDIGGLQVVMDMTRWGEPVDVEPPAPSAIVKAPPALSGMQPS